MDINNIENLVSYIESHHTQLCNDYSNFYRVCTAFATDMGEGGREYARRICQQSDGYQKHYHEAGKDFDVQYNNCLKNHRGTCHINTVFQMAKDAGVDLKGIFHYTYYTHYTPKESHTGASYYQKNQSQQNYSKNLNMINNSQNTENTFEDADYQSENCEPDIIIPDLFKMGDEYAMPDIVRKIVECQHSQPQKNAVFLSSLALLTYIVSDRLFFIYDGHAFYTSPQIIVCGQAASGKSCISETFALVDFLNDRMHNEYRLAKKKYDDEIFKLSTKGRDKANMPRPEKPKYKVALIAPNSSGSATIQAFNDCDGHCCLLAPELSDIIGSNESEHGGIHNSAALRMAYDHDKISLTRRTNDEHIVINSPKLTFIGAGTQVQYKRLIGDAENGQFSRIVYLMMPAVMKFENRFGRNTDVKNMTYNIGRDWTLLIEERLSCMNSIEFLLSDEQNDALYKEFSILNKRANNVGKDMTPFVFRLLVNLIRFMASYAFIRAMEDWNKEECLMSAHPDTNSDNLKDNIITKYQLRINNSDFYWMLSMAMPLFEHGEHAYSLLEEKFAKSNKSREAEILLNNMHKEFTAKEFIALGKQMGFNENRLRQWLKRACDRGIIISLGNGIYQKNYD